MLQLFLWRFFEEFVEPREVNIITVEMIGLDTKKKTIENTINLPVEETCKSVKGNIPETHGMLFKSLP